jgi:hypothetical protein
MNPILRALWNRLLPPGGDVAVAREPLDNANTVRWIRANDCSVSFRQDLRRVGDADPGPHDLGPHGHCWWWPAMGRSWILCHVDNLEPGDIWLPYSAISDPSARP